jgi:hypothetical protein
VSTARIGWIVSSLTLVSFIGYAVYEIGLSADARLPRVKKPSLAKILPEEPETDDANAETSTPDFERTAQPPPLSSAAEEPQSPADETRALPRPASWNGSPLPIPTKETAKPAAKNEAVGVSPSENAFSPLGALTKWRQRQQTQRKDTRKRFRAVVARYKKNRKYPYAPLTRLALEPERYLNKRVSTLGTPWGIQMKAAKPHFTLGDGHGVSARLPVDASRFTSDQKKSLMMLNNGRRVLGLFGTLSRASDGNYFISAAAFEVLEVETHQGGVTISEVLSHPLYDLDKDKETQITRIQAAAAKLKRGRRHPYIDLVDLIIAPRRYRNRRIAVLGVPMNFIAGEKGTHFKIADTWASRDGIDVLASDLPREQQESLFTLSFPPVTVALKGTVVYKRGQAAYLRAENVEPVAWAQDSVQAMVTAPPPETEAPSRSEEAVSVGSGN